MSTLLGAERDVVRTQFAQLHGALRRLVKAAEFVDRQPGSMHIFGCELSDAKEVLVSTKQTLRTLEKP